MAILGRRALAALPPRGRVAYHCKSLSVVGEDSAGPKLALPLYCRKWQCPDCSKHLKKRLKRRLISGRPNAFMTLTTNPAAHETPREAFLNATYAVNKLMKILRRRYPRRRIEYALVWEQTKRGFPHAHILLRSPYIPQTFLSREWKRLSGAQIVDIRMVRTEGEAAAYVSKYLAKDPAVPDGYKRYRTSRQYSEAHTGPTLATLFGIDTWTRSAAPLPSLIQHFAEHHLTFSELWPELYTLNGAQPPPACGAESAERVVVEINGPQARAVRPSLSARAGALTRCFAMRPVNRNGN